ncbi:DUF3404 domain-containing protein [bacterium]|nr:DUF3404 domain-containing protein [bacterium]
MRWNLLLLFLAGLFLFLSLRVRDQWITSTQDSQHALKKIRELKREFFKTHQSQFRFSLEKLRQFQVDPSLLNPSLGFPRTHLYPYAQARVLFEGMKSCRWPNGFSAWHPHLLKAVIWHQFLCTPGSRLPERFLQVQPLMHPFGSSYAYLAFRSARKPYSSKDWLLANREKLHVSELGLLEKFTKLSLAETVAREMGPREWELFLSQTDVLLTKSFLLFARRQLAGTRGSMPVYDGYSRAQWDDFFRETSFSTKDSAEGIPVLVEGNLGYEVNPGAMGQLSKSYQFLALGAILLLGLNLARMMALEIRRRVRAQKERVFILQTLTHELRTPVSTMKLSLEPLREEFEDLPQNSQRAFLRMTEGISRLKRVIEASTQYLRADGEAGEIRFQKEKLELLPWFADFIEEYEVQTRRKLETSFQPGLWLDVDPYWLEMCLQNLLENAFHHGEQPVSVELACKERCISITVQDQGNLTAAQFSSFLDPFRRESEAEGLGLGLTLVQSVVSQMGGEMRFHANPSRVSMNFKEEK